MLAASEGHVNCVRALIEGRASLKIMGKDGRTALMLAVKHSRANVLRELMLEPNIMNDTMILVQDGLRQREVKAADKALKKHEAVITVSDIKEACAGMHEAQPMFERIHDRLADINRQIEAKDPHMKPTKEAKLNHKKNLVRIYTFLSRRSTNRVIMRLVGNRQVMQTCKDMHCQLDEFVRCHSLKPQAIHNWNKHWHADTSDHESFFKASLEQLKCNTNLLENELRDPEAQSETLTLLMFECNNRISKYTEDESNLIQRLFEYIRGFTALDIPLVPDWFVPPHEVEFTMAPFNQGSYGSVHRGSCSGMEVVVKCAFLGDSESRALFCKEAEIWYKLRHQNVVQLFHACHVGNPFFVCEYASEGTLSDYLYRKEYNRVEMWGKLHEAALGLQYLHQKHKLVHGDLKCNNILVGDDGKAKIADFGLSFQVNTDDSESIPSEDVGAICWKAPEVINRETRGTFASDVYSFGMCILEAVKKGTGPWGMMSDVAVKRKVIIEKQLPKRPEDMNELQWRLIQEMCTHDPAKRLQMEDVLDRLRGIAQQEDDDASEAAWREHQAKNMVGAIE